MKKCLPKESLEPALRPEFVTHSSGNNGEPENPLEDSSPEFLPSDDKLLNHPILPHEELVRLIKRVQKKNDAEALEKIVRHNMRFLAVMAKAFAGFGLELWDLIQEGAIGLVVAARRFDPNRGAKFHTYAGFWVRQKLRQATHTKGHLIRVPVGARKLRTQIYRVAEKIAEKTVGAPNLGEIAKELNLPLEVVIDNLNTVMIKPSSLDEERHFGEGGKYTLLDKIPDTTVPEPFEDIDKKAVWEGLRKALDELSPRERRIIELRFGLQGRDTVTLEKVGERMGVTRERIRQIEAKALRKLRHKSRRHLFTDNLGEMPLGISQPSVNSKLAPSRVFSAVYWSFNIRSEEFQRLRKSAPEGIVLQVTMFLLVMDAELSPREVVEKLQLTGGNIVEGALAHVGSSIQRDAKLRDRIAKIRSRYFGPA